MSVLITAHNEEKTLNLCLKSIFNQIQIKEVILVADRCIDRTIEIAKKYNVQILEKNYKKAYYPWGEAINFGIDSIKGKYTFVCDADIYLTKDFIKNILKSVEDPKIGIVSGVCITRGLFHIPYNYTYLGGCKLIQTHLLKRFKCEDLIAWDTLQDLLIEHDGYKVLVNKKAIAYEMRTFNFKNYIKKGILRGFARHQLNTPMAVILLHFIINLFRWPFTFPELIALLLGKIQAKIIRTPILKNLRNEIIQRQLNRIRKILFLK